MRHVLHGGEFAVHGFLQHHFLDHVFLGNAQALGLFRDLLVHQRRTHETGANHVGADLVLGTFLGHDLGQADQAVLGGDVGRLQG